MMGYKAHPDPEVLAAFVAGSLSGDELAEVTEHLRLCEDCRTIVGEAARFDDKKGNFND